jgi:hypothetical protein
MSSEGWRLLYGLGPVFVAIVIAALAVSSMPAAPRDFARSGTVTASSSASEFLGPYGPPRATDGNPQTHWASADGGALPQWFEVRWQRARTVDTILISTYAQPGLYDAWKAWEILFSEGAPVRGELPPNEHDILVRFPARRTSFVRIRALTTHTRTHYVGVGEITVLFDPQRQWSPPVRLPRPLPFEALKPQGRAAYPTVYHAPADLERGRRNAERHAWARKARDDIIAEAQRWLEGSEEHWLQFLPAPGACYAYGFTGCPVCGASWGTWAGAGCSWDNPGHVKCRKGHVLPDEAHPDDGTGYRNPDGRVHYFVGSWNAWVVEQWILHAIPSLARAYALTGDEKYADRGGFFLDALASVYAESTSGSWDYPSSPPSGRLARPWYQVARTMVVMVEAYDLIYGSASLDRPSLRPDLTASQDPGAPPQTRAVGTGEAHGQTLPGMTRRQNIDLNLMRDGAYYCYRHTFDGGLHNGAADYQVGMLSVGCLLGIPEYVRRATEGPCSIFVMLANNIDRDGRYYETSPSYANWARSLYLLYCEPLLNWRDEKHPHGIDLYDDPRFRLLYTLPDLVIDCAGHAPNFGDSSPDNQFIDPREAHVSTTDYRFAERMYAGSREPEDRRLFAAVLKYVSNGDLDRMRVESGMGTWLLFHADDLPAKVPEPPASLLKKAAGSWFVGQKGLGFLRTGERAAAQAALLRFGLSLTHTDYDELGLLYYGGGWQLTYDIGYGLGSAHTHTGWGARTASHNLVVVNESDQLKGAGSGGSLTLFANAPSFQGLEASDENAYGSENVRVYRRTVALVGGSRSDENTPAQPSDVPYLVDIFRVVGGHQHDYFLGVQTQQYAVDGISLGAEETGSLAGPDICWGDRVGNDGDIIGFPNKPYWNPPPGNGYGFFYGVRRGSAATRWTATWPLGGPLDTVFRAHFLPSRDTEPMMAKAPGLYPTSNAASYAVLRRRGAEPLASTFVTIMEPYFRAGASGTSGPKPLIKAVERLECAWSDESPIEPVGVKVTRADGSVDYLFSGDLRGGRRVFATDRGKAEVGGALAYVRFAPDGSVIRAVLHGADFLRIGDFEASAPARAYEGAVTAVDDAAPTVRLAALLPTDGSLDGQTVYFANDAYSRATAYRIDRVERVGNGSVLRFADTSFLLGQGQVLSIAGSDSLLSIVQHEYAHAYCSGNNSHFFDGKLVSNGRGAAARLTAVEFGTPMMLRMASTKGFEPGDALVYHDIARGDRFVIPTTTVLTR